MSGWRASRRRTTVSSRDTKYVTVIFALYEPMSDLTWSSGARRTSRSTRAFTAIIRRKSPAASSCAVTSRTMRPSRRDISRLANMDEFDRLQLKEVVHVCRSCASLSEAGRRLFSVSRTHRAATNDADRLRKYLVRFGLDWKTIKAESLPSA